jgi:hypothetical protein
MAARSGCVQTVQVRGIVLAHCLRLAPRAVYLWLGDVLTVVTQRPDAHAELVGQGAQFAAGTQALVNRGALAVMADRAQAIHAGRPPV